MRLSKLVVALFLSSMSQAFAYGGGAHGSAHSFSAHSSVSESIHSSSVSEPHSYYSKAGVSSSGRTVPVYLFYHTNTHSDDSSYDTKPVWINHYSGTDVESS